MKKRSLISSLRVFIPVAIALLFVECRSNRNAINADALSIDLSSETEWTLSIDGGTSWKRVIVPGGGCNSDLQPNRAKETEIDTHDMIYRRRITIPAIYNGQVSKIVFGAVNFGADVYINGDKNTGHLVTSHLGVNMPFEADITPYAVPGKSYDLYVYAHPKDQYKIDTLYKKHKVVQGKGADQRSVPVGFSFGPSYSLTSDFGIMKFAYGIAKYVNLQIYAPVYIQDVFVRPVVNEQDPGSSSLYLDAWIENSTDVRKDIILTCDLSKWEKNPDKWVYPDIPDRNVSLGPKSKIKVTIGPIPWKLGPKSFWWPNIPFEENYLAKLHRLSIALKDKKAVLGTKTVRFGFCTYSEGPYYYKINGKRFLSVGDGTPESGMSFYDCYTTAEAWTSGCSETLKRYMRLGFNTNRICQATATDHMMNIADEVGFMFIGETSIYGYENDYWFDNYGNHVKELARVYRNHPSTARYILSNEIPVEWTMLIDSIVTEDNTRPLTFETVNNPQFGKITSGQYHAFKMNHYFDMPKERDTNMLRGYGEIAWGSYDTKDSVAMLYFSNSVRKARILDLAHMAPWDLLNYWPNFLQGMNHNLHGWIANNHADRPDDPGRGGNLVSPDVIYMKRSLEPFAIFDKKCEFNKIKHDTLPVMDKYAAGTEVTRNIEIFNGGIESINSDRMKLEWEARWDHKNGPVAASGSTGNFQLTPGWHTAKTISFRSPLPGSTERKLCLVLKSYNDEQLVNIITEYSVIITPGKI